MKGKGVLINNLYWVIRQHYLNQEHGVKQTLTRYLHMNDFTGHMTWLGLWHSCRHRAPRAHNLCKSSKSLTLPTVSLVYQHPSRRWSVEYKMLNSHRKASITLINFRFICIMLLIILPLGNTPLRSNVLLEPSTVQLQSSICHHIYHYALVQQQSLLVSAMEIP